MYLIMQRVSSRDTLGHIGGPGAAFSPVGRWIAYASSDNTSHLAESTHPGSDQSRSHQVWGGTRNAIRVREQEAEFARIFRALFSSRTRRVPGRAEVPPSAGLINMAAREGTHHVERTG